MKNEIAEIYYDAATRYVNFDCKHGAGSGKHMLAKYLPGGMMPGARVRDIPLDRIPDFLADLKQAA